jgi:hypothetical protein
MSINRICQHENNFFEVLGLERRASSLLGRHFYHLSHSASPHKSNFKINPKGCSSGRRKRLPDEIWEVQEVMKSKRR